MRLEPMEVYVLDSFRRNGRSWLRLAEITDGCTVVRRNALDDAVAHLEHDDLLVRCFEFVELTDEGANYLAMTGAEAHDRLERGI